MKKDDKKQINELLANQKTFSATKALYRSTSYASKNLYQTVAWTVSLARLAIKQRKNNELKPNLPANLTPEQRFIRLAKLFNKSDADLIQLQKQAFREFWIWIIAAVMMFIILTMGMLGRSIDLLGYATFYPGGIDFSFGGILRPLVLVGCLLQASKSGFNNWQLRHRSDRPYKDFIKSKEWLPE